MHFEIKKLRMSFRWFLTNLNEEKSYLITNYTLLGTKPYCDIKLWGLHLTENDIRFKIHNDKRICMKILRPDIKTIKITKNRKQKTDSHIHIYNGNSITIESYFFRVTRIETNEGISMEEMLKRVTFANVQKYKEKKKKRGMKMEKITAKVSPNRPALTGTYKNGEMIGPVFLDLTEDF